MQTSVNLLTKQSASLSPQAWTSIIMDGLKACVIFGVVLTLSGKWRPKSSVCVVPAAFRRSQLIQRTVFSSRLRFASSYDRVRQKGFYPAAQLCLQRQLHGQKECGVDGAPAGKHLCLPRLLHGDALHLQCNSGKHRLLHVHLWKPRRPGRRRVRRGQRGWDICLCSR